MITLLQDEWNVLTYIKVYMNKWHMPPRFSDIQSGCGLGSKSNAHTILCVLEDFKLIERKYRKARYIKLLPSVGMIGVEP